MKKVHTSEPLHPHPLANDMTDQPQPERSDQEIAAREQHESLEHELESPTSPQRKRELGGMWLGFGIWTLLIIIAAAVTAVIRGGFDSVSLLIFLGIPLGLMFMFPILMGISTKSAQDETVRRLGEG